MCIRDSAWLLPQLPTTVSVEPASTVGPAAPGWAPAIAPPTCPSLLAAPPVRVLSHPPPTPQRSTSCSASATASGAASPPASLSSSPGTHLGVDTAHTSAPAAYLSRPRAPSDPH